MRTTLAYLPVLLLVTSLVQCSAFRGNSALAAEGLVMQRIQSERSLPGYYSRLGDSGRDLIARLNERSMELGAIPSRSETLRILVDSRTTLTDSERPFFEGLIRRLQQPPVTGRKLFEKYQAFSRATSPLNCTYRIVTHVNRWSAGDKSHFPQVVNCKFSRSPGTTFLSKSGDLFSKNVLRVTWIFNGVEMREIEEARQGLSNEYVYVPPNVRSLYPEHHPFTAARIAPLEGAQKPGVRHHSGFAVFKDPTMFVFETPDECDGKDCIVVGSLGSAAIFLAPSLDYAVVEERFGELDFNGQYRRTTPHYRKQNSDFIKLGNGPFVPRRSLVELRRKGRLMERVEMIVESLSVRPEHTFAETFERPEPIHVNNDVTGQTHLIRGAKPGGTDK